MTAIRPHSFRCLLLIAGMLAGNALRAAFSPEQLARLDRPLVGESIALAPDGQHVAYTLRTSGRLALAIADLAVSAGLGRAHVTVHAPAAGQRIAHPADAVDVQGAAQPVSQLFAAPLVHQCVGALLHLLLVAALTLFIMIRVWNAGVRSYSSASS